MEIDFYIQSQAFLYSLLFGVGLGMLYGIFKFIRVAFLSTKTAVIIADIIFMLIASIALFLYSLAMLYGYVRIYIVFGALCGFLAYRFSLGKLISRIYCPIINAVLVLKNATLINLNMPYNIPSPTPNKSEYKKA